jgi:hypothetical protein
MRRKRISTEFIMDYLARQGDEYRSSWKNRFEEYRSDFRWNDGDRADFRRRVTGSGLIFTDTTATARYTSTGDTLYMNPSVYQKEMWVIEGALKAELAQQMFGSSQYFIVWNDIFDVTLKEAVKLWPEVSALRENTERIRVQQGILRQ